MTDTNRSIAKSVALKAAVDVAKDKLAIARTKKIFIKDMI